jgi:hypothetical protein
MFLKSHHWVNEPTSRTERRNVLHAVRQRTETARLFDIKYRDIDTGKLDTDCLPTLNSTSYLDLIETDQHDQFYGNKHRHHFRRLHESCHKVERWFTPKDDDFDKECELEETKPTKPTKPIEQIKPKEPIKPVEAQKVQYKEEMMVVGGNMEPRCIDVILSVYNRSKYK